MPPETQPPSTAALEGQGGDSIDLKAISYKVMISLEKQHERRRQAQEQFVQLGLEVEWKIPVKVDEIPWDMLPPVYRKGPKYASQVMTLFQVFHQVIARKADSFMLLEDDIVFHPDFQNQLSAIRVPSDWKFLYIGGRNNGKKQPVGPGLVRSTFISDLHAVIIRSDMIEPLRGVLLDPGIRSYWADYRFATLHKSAPAYLCRPNLAWQSIHQNDTGTGPAYSNYRPDGSVMPGVGN